MMERKAIGDFREIVETYAPQEFAARYPSIYDCMSEDGMQHKSEIVNYLRSSHIEVATTSPARDVLTGEQLPFADVGLCDDVYRWGIDLPYYIEKYNVVLPDEVIEHILEKLALADESMTL